MSFCLSSRRILTRFPVPEPFSLFIASSAFFLLRTSTVASVSSKEIVNRVSNGRLTSSKIDCNSDKVICLRVDIINPLFFIEDIFV